MDALIARLISLGLFRFLGIGAIGALIWYTGPYIDFLRPTLNRLIAIAVVVALYCLYLLVRKLQTRRKEKKMSDDLAASADAGVDPSRERSNEEIATLKEKFDDALKVLRKSGCRPLPATWTGPFSPPVGTANRNSPARSSCRRPAVR
jgi:type VI secretion system protein ImpL